LNQRVVNRVCSLLPQEKADSSDSAFEKEVTVYASIRRYKIHPDGMAELARRVNEGFAPLISQAPGFVTYFALDAGNDVVASVSVFQDQAGAEQSNRLAADWVQRNLVELIASAPEITSGEVLVHL